MSKVAKLLMKDSEGNYLMMYRSDHPTFGRDPDLPGGTMEANETLVETMIREVFEEAGVVLKKSDAKEVYAGTDYSAHKTLYALFVAEFKVRPEIVMSWEHSSYRWLDRDSFLREAKNAQDTFMHMVYEVVRTQS